MSSAKRDARGFCLGNNVWKRNSQSSPTAAEPAGESENFRNILSCIQDSAKVMHNSVTG